LIPVIADAQTPLPREKGEITAQFEEKFLQTVNQGFFESVFGVFIFEFEELQNKRVFNLLFRGQQLGRISRLAPAKKSCLGSRQLGALEELRRDLAVELPNGPATAQSFGFVKCAGLLVVDREKADVMRPRKGKRRRPSEAWG
jgi:hypothetical protein